MSHESQSARNSFHEPVITGSWINPNFAHRQLKGNFEPDMQHLHIAHQQESYMHACTHMLKWCAHATCMLYSQVIELYLDYHGLPLIPLSLVARCERCLSFLKLFEQNQLLKLRDVFDICHHHRDV